MGGNRKLRRMSAGDGDGGDIGDIGDGGTPPTELPPPGCALQLATDRGRRRARGMEWAASLCAS